MCAQFTLKARASDLSRALRIQLNEIDWNQEWDFRVRGFMKTEEAPVLVCDEAGNFQIKSMKFSLCPSWSREFPCAFTTYNARMERPRKNAKPGVTEKIFEVPTWKESFVNGQTCLVPLTTAIESSYFGRSAGQMIHFSQAGAQVYFALGLWSTWADRRTGEVQDTFALLTDDPYEFFFQHGHDRSILVIDSAKHESWLRDKPMSPKDRFEFIRKNRISLDWQVQMDRPLKSGWEKRAPTKEEIEGIKVWRKSGSI